MPAPTSRRSDEKVGAPGPQWSPSARACVAPRAIHRHDSVSWCRVASARPPFATWSSDVSARRRDRFSRPSRDGMSSPPPVRAPRRCRSRTLRRPSRPPSDARLRDVLARSSQPPRRRRTRGFDDARLDCTPLCRSVRPRPTVSRRARGHPATTSIPLRTPRTFPGTDVSLRANLHRVRDGGAAGAWYSQG